MARPREFDEKAVLDAAVQCFWSHGYEATSIRDLIEKTSLTNASLYNAFGDKRALFRAALDRYVEETIADRIRRCEALPPHEAIATFFDEVVSRSLNDSDKKGCMLVNSAIDVAPHDRVFQEAVAGVLVRIENFFLRQVIAGQNHGAMAVALPADDIARHLLGTLMGVRVLARVRPERALLEGVVRPALAFLGLEPLGSQDKL